MIAEVTALPKLLAGFRRQPEGDRAALVAAMVALSLLAAEAGDTIESLDINPLAVLAKGSGAVALDALIGPR